MFDQFSSSLQENSLETEALSFALNQVQLKLQTFFATSTSSEQLNQVFDVTDPNATNVLIANGKNGIFDTPQLQILPDAMMNGANAAFSVAKDTIYLTESLVESDILEIEKAIIEEMGHKFDTLLNPTSDTPGDEGEKFKNTVLNLPVSDLESWRIQTENDFGTIIVNGEVINVEQSYTSLVSSAPGFTKNKGGWTDNSTYPRVSGDVNGDGLDDIVGFASNRVYVSLSNSNGTFGAPIASLPSSTNGFTTGVGGWTDNNNYPRVLGDVNGDNKDDIVGFGGSNVFVSLSNGNGTFAAPVAYNIAFTKNNGGWTNNNTYPRMLGDVNGDGRDDIVGFGSNRVHVSLSNSNGSFGTPIASLPSSTNGFTTTVGGWTNNNTYPRMLGDVNGDGKDDIVGFGASRVFVSLSNGNGTFSSPIGSTPSANNGFTTNVGGWTDNNNYPRMLADVNGDNKDDIVGFGGSGVFVSLSNGNGSFAAPTPYNIALTKNNGSWSDNNNYPRIVGDVNGDNKGDLIGFGATNVFTSLSGINTVNPPTSKPTVTLSVADSSAAETTSGQTANPGQFTVTRTGTTTAPLVVYYTTGGTATKGTDYQNLTGSVIISTGSTTANITIDVIDDSLVEPSKTVIVNLSANTNYNAGNGGNYVDYGDTSGTVTIADNDFAIPSTDWTAEYFNNVSLSGTPVFTENLGSGSQNFNKNWGGSSPASSVPVDNFSARFTTERYLAPGLYHITTNTDDGARVFVGNERVIDRWIPGAGNNSGYFYSNGGNYPIKVEYLENSGGAAINFDIINYTPFNNFGDPNGIANSWGASFYHWNGQGTTPSFSAGDLIGTVNLGSSTRSDGKWGMNAQNWGDGAVLGDRNLPHDNFVMDAYTRINFEVGHTYKVGLSSDDGYRMWAHKLNGNPFNITNNAVGGTWMMDAYGGKEFTFTAPESGTFDFHVQMFEGAGNAYFDLTVQDVTTPPPPSGLMATPTNLTKLINGQLNGQYIDVDGWYGAQCWDLVAYAAGINSSSTYWLTTHWKPGANVMGNGNVTVGTAIATFLGPNGAYDNPYGGQHTAIFAGYGTQNGVSGFYVWDQNWSPGYIQKHFIGNNQSSTSDADNYYVIQV